MSRRADFVPTIFNLILSGFVWVNNRNCKNNQTSKQANQQTKHLVSARFHAPKADFVSTSLNYRESHNQRSTFVLNRTFHKKPKFSLLSSDTTSASKTFVLNRTFHTKPKFSLQSSDTRSASKTFVLNQTFHNRKKSSLQSSDTKSGSPPLFEVKRGHLGFKTPILSSLCVSPL